MPPVGHLEKFVRFTKNTTPRPWVGFVEHWMNLIYYELLNSVFFTFCGGDKKDKTKTFHMMPNLDSGKWSIFDKAENMRTTLDAGFNHYHQDHGALQRSNDIYIYLYTHKKFIPTLIQFLKEMLPKKKLLNKNIFQDWECAIFFDINPVVWIPSVKKSSCSSWLSAGDCRKCFWASWIHKLLIGIVLFGCERSKFLPWKLNWLTSLGCSRYIYCLSQIVVLVENVWTPSVLFTVDQVFWGYILHGYFGVARLRIDI